MAGLTESSSADTASSAESEKRKRKLASKKAKKKKKKKKKLLARLSFADAAEVDDEPDEKAEEGKVSEDHGLSRERDSQVD